MALQLISTTRMEIAKIISFSLTELTVDFNANAFAGF